MAISKRIAWPLGSGLAGMMGLMLLYLGIVTWAEGLAHALDLFWEDRWIVLPIVLGFGVQAALYTILRKGLFVPVATAASGGKLMGASGATSTAAMVACCATGSPPNGRAEYAKRRIERLPELFTIALT